MLRQLLGLLTFRSCQRQARLLCVTMFGLSALTAAHAQGANLIANGGFEDGPSGWMWEQWDNKPLPGVIDKAEHPEGAASFKFGLAGATAGRWLACEVKLPAADKDYKLTFMAKGENLPAAAARARVAIEGKGFLGSASGEVDVMKEGGSFPWRKYEVSIPAAELGGAGMITLFFYDDQPGQGSLWIDGVSLALPTTAASAAAAEPEDNTNNMVDNGGFEAGENGWQWEQWDNKPLPGIVDKTDRIRGAASFKMGLPGGTGSRWMGREIKLPKPGQDYVLSFWLKPTDLPPDAAYVRLGIDGSGWLGTAEGKSDIVRLGGSGDWKQ
jgi:hypothetical protein